MFCKKNLWNNKIYLRIKGCEMSRRWLGAEIAHAIFRANRPSEAKS